MIIAAFILLIVLDAVGDAVKNKPLKHLLQTFLVGFWLLMIYAGAFMELPEIHTAVIGYALLRYFLFDAVWNVTSGKRIDYIGSTSLYDKILSGVHPSMILFTKLIAGATGIGILI